MKAVVYEKYGSPDVLELKEVEKPRPKDDEVLVKLHATSLNASDWEFLTATPAYVRSWGLFKPTSKILGSDIAGRVEAVGKNITKFKQGDAVFGDVMYTKGGLAEYVCAPENSLYRKPEAISFEVAAALPQSACVALQGLRDKGHIQTGQKILIIGAGGGAGSFAVQFAKLFGTEVTGVDSSEKLDMLRSIGADHVIDYTMEDFSKNGQQYDLILGLVAPHSIFKYKRALKPDGIYALVGGSVPRILLTVFWGAIISRMGSKDMGMLIAETNKDLDYIAELIIEGKVTPIIEKQYPLEEAAKAMRYLGDGHVKGKLVITIADNNSI